MSKLSQSDLDSFRQAVFKDYGLKLKGKAVYEAAFNLLEFFKALIKFDKSDKKNEVRKLS
jgi:hypothetical protein